MDGTRTYTTHLAPDHVANGPNGSIYFTQPGSITQFTADGKLRDIFGSPTGTKGLAPVCSAGQQDTAFPCSEGQLSNIGGIAVDSDGSLYVSETNGAEGWVLKITKPGSAACQARL